MCGSGTLFTKTMEYIKMKANHARILAPILIVCHLVTVLHIIRRRRLTVMTRHVNAVELISHNPNIFPAEVKPVVLENTAKLYTTTD